MEYMMIWYIQMITWFLIYVVHTINHFPSASQRDAEGKWLIGYVIEEGVHHRAIESSFLLIEPESNLEFSTGTICTPPRSNLLWKVDQKMYRIKMHRMFWNWAKKIGFFWNSSVEQNFDLKFNKFTDLKKMFVFLLREF